MYYTRWKSNPLTNGSYSYLAVDQSGDEFDVLAEPLQLDGAKTHEPRVCFAGEATHNHFFSTVHGAIESGYREADRIINLFTVNNN